MSNASSGIVNGIIPASRRPDGSVRKEIKVRQGYTPPEDVQKYQSKAQLNQAKAKGYIAGMGMVKQEKVLSKSQIKNQKRKNKKESEEALYLIMHGLLEEMRLEDLKQILESIEDFEPGKMTFNEEKEATKLRILNGFSKDSKGIGQRIFSVAKITELRRLCSSLNLSDTGDRNAVLEKINNYLKDRFKEVYTMDLTRPFDDFQSGNLN
jgi:partner of Y14 and mago protein